MFIQRPAPPLRFPQLSSPWPRARVLVLFFIALLLVGIRSLHRLTQGGLVIDFAVSVAVAGRRCRMPSQVAGAGDQVA